MKIHFPRKTRVRLRHLAKAMKVPTRDVARELMRRALDHAAERRARAELVARMLETIHGRRGAGEPGIHPVATI